MIETRKEIRLKDYDYSAKGWYFVTICTKEKKCFLGTIVGADVLIGPQMKLSELGQQVDNIIASMPSVDKFVVMPNHVHMILRVGQGENGPMGTSAPTESLPYIVRYLKRSVTQICGQNIWQRSYYDHIIRDRGDYLRIWHYIDINPAKWSEDRCCVSG